MTDPVSPDPTTTKSAVGTASGCACGALRRRDRRSHGQTKNEGEHEMDPDLRELRIVGVSHDRPIDDPNLIEPECLA